jgi:hypothetical protein
VERDTPAEIEAAAEKFKINQAMEQLLIKNIRQQERADLLEKIAAAFKQK